MTNARVRITKTRKDWWSPFGKIKCSPPFPQVRLVFAVDRPAGYLLHLAQVARSWIYVRGSRV